MATYVLKDNVLTDEQRNRYWFELCPEDAVEFMAHVLEHFPAVYDDAVLNTGRVNRLATLQATSKGTR